MPWLSPTLNLKWGSYFREDPAEQKQLVDMTVAAKDAGLITKRIALERLAGVFDVDNIDAVLEALDKEADENMKRAQENAKAMAAAAPNAPPGGQPKPGAAMPGKPMPPKPQGAPPGAK